MQPCSLAGLGVSSIKACRPRSTCSWSLVPVPTWWSAARLTSQPPFPAAPTNGHGTAMSARGLFWSTSLSTANSDVSDDLGLRDDQCSCSRTFPSWRPAHKAAAQIKPGKWLNGMRSAASWCHERYYKEKGMNVKLRAKSSVYQPSSVDRRRSLTWGRHGICVLGRTIAMLS